MKFTRDYYGGTVEDTELSWGRGAVPPGKEHAPPDQGGKYVGRAPSMVDPPKRKDKGYRPSGAPVGYAGEQIAL